VEVSEKRLEDTKAKREDSSKEEHCISRSSAQVAWMMLLGLLANDQDGDQATAGAHEEEGGR